jgi:hypothetical protein
MRTHSRLALAVLSIGSTLAATSAHASIGGGGGSIGGGGNLNSPADVIGTGKTVNQTWTLLDYDAKRLAVVTYLNGLNSDFADISNTDINDALGLPRSVADGTINIDMGNIPLGASVDADAYANASATAYVNQAAGWWTGSSMGIRGQAKLGGYLTVSASAGSYSGSPLDYHVQPGVTAEVSYVKPGFAICWVGSCGASGPYFHEVVDVIEPNGSSLYHLDQVQPNPLAIQRLPIPAIHVPSVDPFTAGPFVITPSETVEALFNVSASLDPTGGQLNIDVGVKATAGITATTTLKAGPESANVAVKATATLIDGHNPMSNPWGSADTGAQAHAVAYLNAGTNWLLGNQLCYGARASFDAAGIVGWSYDLSASANGLLRASKDIFNDSASGASYTQGFTPVSGCIGF